MKKIFISSLIILLLCGCSTKKQTKETDSVKFKKEYESLNNDKYINVSISDNNHIEYASLDEIIDIIENKTGLIYLGYPESIACRDSIEVLIDAIKQTGLKKVYYLNITHINIDKKTEEKLEIIKKYVNDFEGINLIFVKDKENIGTISSLDKDYKQMSDEEKNELLKIYKNSIHQMLDDLCDESC